MGAPGTYAFELRQTCDGYVINQRMRLEVEGSKGSVVSEQTSQMTESRDGRKLRFEHRSAANGKQTSLLRGDATLDDERPRPVAVQRAGRPVGRAAQGHAVPQCA